MIMNFKSGRMTKWKGRAASMAPSALSISVVALMAAGTGVANAQDITIDEIQTEQVVIDDGTQSLTITGDGAINITGSTTAAIVADDVIIPTTVVNNGAISVVGSGTYAAGFYGYGTLTGSITNNGTITIVTDATANDGDVNAGGIGVGEDVAYGASISNSNSISTTVNIAAADPVLSDRQGVYVAGIVTGDVLGEVDNTGDITTNLDVAGAPGEDHYSSVNGIRIGDLGEYGEDYGGSLDNSGAISVTTSIASEAPYTSNSAYGIYADELFGDSTLTNSGDINVSQTLTGDAEGGYGYGYYGPGEDGPGYYGPRYYGAIKSADAYGIKTDDLQDSAAFDNSGDITVTQAVSGDANLSLANAYGIETDNIEDDSTFTNSGDIIVSQTMTGDIEGGFGYYGPGYEGPGFYRPRYYGAAKLADAYGIKTNDVEDYATFNNSGDITITQTISGDAYQSSANAYGIDADYVEYDGSFTNTGDIALSQTMTGDGFRTSADAYGIYTSDIQGYGTFNNGGNISITQALTGDAYQSSAGAYGIETDTIENYSTFTNTGDIVVSQTVSGEAETRFGYYGPGYYYFYSSSSKSADAYGVKTDDVEDYATFSNSGDITITQTISGYAYRSNASAYGIEADRIEDEGIFTNSGDIVISQAISGDHYYKNADAYGIYTDDIEDDAIFNNSGDITVTSENSGSAGYSNVDIYGIYTTEVENSGTFINSGDIAVTAIGSGSAYRMDVNATGIYIETVDSDATVSNTGDIVAIVNASNSDTDRYGSTTGTAIAVEIDTLDGSFSNSGSLIARSNVGDAYALLLSGDSDSEVTLTAIGMIEGMLDVDVENLTVISVEETGQIFWTFEDLDSNVANESTFLTLVDTDGPTLVRIGDVITTLAGPSTQSQSADAQMIAEAILLGSDKALSMLRTGGSDVASRMHTGAGAKGITAFADVGYVSRSHDDVEFGLGAATGGVIGAMQNGFDYTVALTGFSASGEVTSDLGDADTSSSGFSIGAYGHTDLGSVSLGFGATFGSATNDSERLVNDNLALFGVGTIDAEFGTTFISPAVEVSYATQVGGMTVTPRAGFRYTMLMAEAYEETGGAAAMEVDERTTNVSDLTIGVDAARAMGSGVLTASADVLMRSISGDDFDMSLAGVTGTTTGTSDDFTAIDFGIGYEMAVGEGIVSIDGSAMLGDVEGYGVSARYEISF